MKKLLALLIAVAMTVACLASCGKNNTGSASDEHIHTYGEWEVVAAATCTEDGLRKRTCTGCGDVESEPLNALGHDWGDDDICVRCGVSQKSVANLVYGRDYVSLYEQFGKNISIADVKEDIDEATGKHTPYIEKDGKKYVLGLDFLSMAMVYNTKVPAGSTEYKTEDDVYAKWWMYYIQRWNELLPEIPLYSNEYYDLFNTQIKGVKEHPTNPYWSVANALIDWTSEKPANDFIVGNTTELSGKFRYPTFGASSPGAADNDIASLVSGLETVIANKEGGFQWNDTVVKAHSEVINEDGSKTFEIELNDGLKFSDGSAVTAKNYVVSTLVFSSLVGAEAAKKDHQAGKSYVGYKAFAAYDGTNGADEGVSKYFDGLKILSDTKFTVTVDAEYTNYFYAVSLASFSPDYLAVWLDDADVVVDPETHAVGLSDAFYAKNGDSYVKASYIYDVAMRADKQLASAFPYSGPYKVVSYDTLTKTAVLEKNEYFIGNYEKVKPSIQKITYVKSVSDTQLASFKSGDLDFIAGITGGADTDEAIKYADSSNGKAEYIHYGRAGYGKLAFRADYGSTQFVEVRQALALSMNRTQFALDFNGGYGGTVDGPYYKGSWMYKAVEDEIVLDSYASSVDAAKAKLVAGGWIYSADGSDYVSGVRYKKIKAAEIGVYDAEFQSKDGTEKTRAFNADGQEVAVNSEDVAYYLMPLVINWFGTSDNPFSETVITYLCGENSIATKAGFKIEYTLGDFGPMLDEYYQQAVYGFYKGTPMYNMFNFATGFNSAAYDYAYNMTIDPDMYDDYSMNYIKDINDFYFL